MPIAAASVPVMSLPVSNNSFAGAGESTGNTTAAPSPGDEAEVHVRITDGRVVGHHDAVAQQRIVSPRPIADR